MEPVIVIVTKDGRRLEAGVKYARGYDGANAEALEVYGLKKGEYELECIRWINSSRPDFHPTPF